MCKVFMYESEIENRTPIYLNGPDSVKPEILFTCYVNWWNKDFAPDEGLDPDGFEDYKYTNSFCPIDFCDDYKDLYFAK